MALSPPARPILGSHALLIYGPAIVGLWVASIVASVSIVWVGLPLAENLQLIEAANVTLALVPPPQVLFSHLPPYDGLELLTGKLGVEKFMRVLFY